MKCIVSLLSLVLLCGCASVPRTNGIPNFQTVDAQAQIYCGGLPDAAGWEVIRALGVRVINLTPTPDPALPGRRMLQFPITTYQQQFGLVGPQLDAAYQNLTADPQNVFIHCQHGMNRTRTLIRRYRIEHDAWPPARATAEANAYGWSSSFRALKSYFP